MKFTISLSDVRVNPNALDPVRINAFLQREATNQKAKLDQGIASGMGVDGQEIKPGGYSPGYRAAIRKGQVKAPNGVRKVQEEPVNLTISGDMLRARQVSQGADGKSAEIKFGSGAEAAKAGHLLARGFQHWNEFGQEDVKRIEESFGALVSEMAANIFTK